MCKYIWSIKNVEDYNRRVEIGPDKEIEDVDPEKNKNLSSFNFKAG